MRYKETLKSLLPKTILDARRQLKLNSQKKKWISLGKPLPIPHEVKQLYILQMLKKYPSPIFIETGTFNGDMLLALNTDFKQLYSIELSETLWKKSKKRLENIKNIQLIKGDSSIELLKLTQKIKQACIFWLDGHYSGGNTAKGRTNCPIVDELNAIIKSNIPNYLILIDDARLFNGENEYPSINELKKIMSGFNIQIEMDIICFIKNN